MPRRPSTLSLTRERCARAANGHATAAPPTSVMNSRRFIALTPKSKDHGNIAGHGAASQQKRPLMSALGLGRVKTLWSRKECRFGSLREWGPALFRVRLCSDRCHERLDAHDVHYAREIVGQNV